MASRAQLHAELIRFLRQNCPVCDECHLVLLGWMVAEAATRPDRLFRPLAEDSAAAALPGRQLAESLQALTRQRADRCGSALPAVGALGDPARATSKPEFRVIKVAGAMAEGSQKQDSPESQITDGPPLEGEIQTFRQPYRQGLALHQILPS